MFPWLSVLILLPLIGGFGLLAVPDERPKLAKALGMALSGLTLLLSIAVIAQVKAETFHFQLVERASWIAPLGVSYALGIDGVSLWLVLLTTVLGFIAASFGTAVNDRTRLFLALVLILEAAMLGAFLSLDLILFFTFFELTLLPMFFLIAVWGGEHRRRAATKFIVYTFAGSIFMLVGMVALALQHRQVTGALSFSILDIQQAVADGRLWANAVQAQVWIFWAFALALLIKTPAFPFHSWIPDTYAEAPVAAPILSSVMVKMGTYGFLRFCLPLMPEAAQASAPVISGLAVIGILYGAAVAAVQRDARRTVAYSSLSHMGFILLGIFSLSHTGLMGAGFQQFAHGITTTLLLMVLGFLLLRRGTTDFTAFGGLKAKVPVMATVFFLGMVGSLGLPATNGFVGEFMALMGAFETGVAGRYGLNVGFAVLAGLGVVLAAVYLLGMYARLFLGPLRTDDADMPDLHPREFRPAAALVLFIFVGGLAPTLFLRPTEASTQAARLMAVNPPSLRPVWNDPNHEIAANGDLTQGGQLLAPADTHPGLGTALATRTEAE